MTSGYDNVNELIINKTGIRPITAQEPIYLCFDHDTDRHRRRKKATS